MAMKIHILVFWIVTSCSDIVGFHGFGGLCCLHLQGEESRWRKESPS